MKNFVLEQKKNIWFGTFPLLSEAGVVNACSCRLHGQSALVEDTLNLALHVHDVPELVRANRKLFADAIGVPAERFTTCAQVHGSKVQVVTEELVGAGAIDFADTIADTDALVTKLTQVPLLLFFADCVPVLLVDRRLKVIGLAHAGWRGTVADIAAKTVRTMQEAFGSQPQDIVAAIGPSIGSCCYEVDDFVRDKAEGYEEYFTPIASKSGHYMLDLWGYNMAVLRDAGVPAEQIVCAEVCTADNHELFCSYRAENGVTGRMGVCMMLK